MDDPSDRTGVSLGRSEASPWRTLWQRFRPDRSLAPRVLLGTVAVSAMAVVIEALLFNALLDLGTWIEPTGLRTAALLLVGIFLATTMALELLNGEAVLRIGRQLETRLRSAFLSKVPRLGDRFFRTRLRSDMAERGHSAYALRGLPVLATDLVGTIVELAFTVLAMAILFPQSAPIAVVAAILAVCLPVAAQPLLGEQDLRLRNQTGALSRYYLDALLGHTAVRAHGAERVVRREHANLLRKWHFSGLQLLRTTIGLATLQSLVGFGLAASIVLTHLRGFGPGAGILLLTYWALKIPALGHRIVGGLQRLPYYRSLTVRTLEPLAATEETDRAAQNPPPTPNENGPPVAGGRGVSVDLRDLSIQIGGQLILDEVGLSIEGGRHVAILGRSGAGKSTLVGALLGWSRPATGTIVVDGLPLTGERLDWLRQRTVWIDPSVQLWNQSLIENLRYGSSSPLPIGEVLSEARLDDLLNTLPRGLDTSLGEGGGLVSGGEGQRVRFGRGLGRPEAELVILDEPFRGLGADAQRELLTRARRRWRDATLLCVTHDLQAASTFETVVVMESGRLRESGSPADLLEDSDSLYRRLVDEERKLQGSLWTADRWRRLRIGRDGLREMTPNGESP